MGEDVTKLKKNIEAIKKVMKGGIKNDSKKEGSSDTGAGSKKE